MLIGNKTFTSRDAFTPSAGHIYLLPPAALTEPQALSKLAAYFGAEGNGVALVRPVVYTEAGELVAVGPEQAVPDPLADLWLDLALGSATGGLLREGSYRFGYWIGGTASALKVSTLAGPGKVATAPYSSSGQPPSQLAMSASVNFALFAVTFDPWKPPEEADDMYYGRLPWEASQRAFTETSGPQAKSRVPEVTVGWHAVNFDVEIGAFAIARQGGPMEDLVGQRLLITRRRGVYSRSVAVYCYAQRAFPQEVQNEDLSLTRRAFLGLSGLEQDTVLTDVETMA